MKRSVKHRTSKAPRRARADAPGFHELIWRMYPGNSQHPLSRTLGGGLNSDCKRILKLVQAIAAWNRVPADGKFPDASLRRQLSDLLDMDPDIAMSLHADPRYGAFPPYADFTILGSSYVSRPLKDAVKGTLQLCVPTPLHNFEPLHETVTALERLRTLINPETWSQCGLFWSNIRGADRITASLSHTPSVQGRLHLLGDTGVNRLNATVHIQKFDADNPLRAQIDFSIVTKAILKRCSGRIVVEKEQGRPGAVRVTNEKTVAFAANAGPLGENPAGAVKYWLQAETIAIVDALLGSTQQ